MEVKITLEAARVNAGYNQKNAAKKLKVNPATLSNWEHGITIPSWDKVREMEKLYNMSSDFLNLSNNSLKTNK
ncbi:MAG: helix-turn-helix transcriptional regulator [Clostridia bacterium]|nr:helix-turn-helix transcriptional regulator [Clostridia bacterium]